MGGRQREACNREQGKGVAGQGARPPGDGGSAAEGSGTWGEQSPAAARPRTARRRVPPSPFSASAPVSVHPSPQAPSPKSTALASDLAPSRDLAFWQCMPRSPRLLSTSSRSQHHACLSAPPSAPTTAHQWSRGSSVVTHQPCPPTPHSKLHSSSVFAASVVSCGITAVAGQDSSPFHDWGLLLLGLVQLQTLLCMRYRHSHCPRSQLSH